MKRPLLIFLLFSLSTFTLQSQARVLQADNKESDEKVVIEKRPPIYVNASTYYYEQICEYEGCSQAILYHRFAEFKNNTYFFNKSLKIDSEGSYFLVLLIAGVFAFFTEFLQFARFNLQAVHFADFNPLLKYEKEKQEMEPKLKFQLLLLYFLQAALSYLCLILLFSLDLGMLFCISLGYTAGYLCFGFKRRKAYLYIYNPRADKNMLEIET